jgi:hypothetical protein
MEVLDVPARGCGPSQGCCPMKVDKTPAKLAKCGPPWAATARHSKKVPSVSAGRSAAGEVAFLAKEVVDGAELLLGLHALKRLIPRFSSSERQWQLSIRLFAERSTSCLATAHRGQRRREPHQPSPPSLISQSYGFCRDRRLSGSASKNRCNPGSPAPRRHLAPQPQMPTPPLVEPLLIETCHFSREPRF